MNTLHFPLIHNLRSEVSKRVDIYRLAVVAKTTDLPSLSLALVSFPNAMTESKKVKDDRKKRPVQGKIQTKVFMKEAIIKQWLIRYNKLTTIIFLPIK